jgi:hypothetical protein
MAMGLKSKGWKLFTVDDPKIGRPMRANESWRDDGRSMVMWRQRNFMHVDMRYGGTVDVKKYSGVCTNSISGCNALAVMRINGSVTECFFGHSTADLTDYFVSRAVKYFDNDLQGCHAVLVENYSASSDSKADILINARLPASNFLVYTNTYRHGDQTFGVRFSDGLIGEVHVRKETSSLTEPTSSNDFVRGFNTVPDKKSEYQLLNIYEPFDIGNLYALIHAKEGGLPFVFAPEEQRSLIAEHGNRVLTKYLSGIRGESDFQDVKLLLKDVYRDFDFNCLKL